MFANVDAALETAKKAVADGEKTLKDAKQTLETLKGTPCNFYFLT